MDAQEIDSKIKVQIEIVDRMQGKAKTSVEPRDFQCLESAIAGLKALFEIRAALFSDDEYEEAKRNRADSFKEFEQRRQEMRKKFDRT